MQNLFFTFNSYLSYHEQKSECLLVRYSCAKIDFINSESFKLQCVLKLLVFLLPFPTLSSCWASVWLCLYDKTRRESVMDGILLVLSGASVGLLDIHEVMCHAPDFLHILQRKNFEMLSVVLYQS